jgi:periplasmic divalent cation tolerance protein
MKFCSIFIPCATKIEAKKISKVLLESQLVACSNIISGVESMFRWEGKIESSKEVLLILKTRGACVPDITKKVEELHSYDCPVVEVLEIKDGNADFLEWITREAA